ncbi:MAG: tyrosine-type recombinase/integrase [Novosphingobium sp.]
MVDPLNRQAIEGLISQARRVKGKQFELADNRVAGLRIRAGERSATWLLCTRLRNGKRTRIKLGAWPAMGLSDARDAARAKHIEVVEGADPNEAKRETKREAERVARTQRKLSDVLDDYERVKLSQLRCGDNVRRAIDGRSGLLRKFGAKDIASITRTDIVDAVRKHAEKAPMAANRNLAYVKAFMNWCIDQEIVESNPASTIKKPSKERTRDRFHTLDELTEIWDAMGELGYPFGPLYRLLIVVPMRREEIAGMPVAELELAPGGNPDDAVWTLPGHRTKRGNALRVPLSSLAIALIEEALAASDRPDDSPFVFSMTGDTSVSGYAKAKRRLDRIIRERREKAANETGREPVQMEHWTIHDLRTTFSTLACEVLGADISVVDRILNHVATATTSKIMRVYNKSELFEPRKRVMRDWAGLIEREAAKRLVEARACS